jgi:hydrogenase maturation protein HypF
MASFVMCADCESEYRDSGDRRFHAEPTACAVCGPALSERIETVIAALARDPIVAIKGFGGFQLACNAFSESACIRLRERKRKNRKAFALMLRKPRRNDCPVGNSAGPVRFLTRWLLVSIASA